MTARRRTAAFAAAISLATLAMPRLTPADAAAGLAAAARVAEPVVITGAQIPSWSRTAAHGVPSTHDKGGLDATRDAHNGTLVVPPDARVGVPVDEVAAYAYEDGAWMEVPVQVDERFPYFLANGRSDFGVYSGTDEELTYAWDTESWKLTAGTCEAEYPPGESAMADPVPGLDDDDEIVFMASDAGALAPALAPPPPGTSGRHEVALADPLDPAGTRFLYLFRQPAGATFAGAEHYVRYDRDPDANQWVDRSFWPSGHPENLGSSNTGYGPNLAGTVCGDPTDPATARPSTDRWPRDGVTVRTAAYEWRATGRWMVREMRVAKPGQPGVYGPDLIDRWKGRAFQQNPDSSVSLVGFEDEQVNWEANSALLGELTGPVRAIRETWGADSGTNVTKTETFYRDAVTYRYRVRVHPIPPDGLYSSWDYNAGAADTYYNALRPDGVAVDGLPDDVGQIDEVGGQPVFFDAPDPTFGVPTVFMNWEQVAGRDDFGSLVYLFDVTGPTSLANPAVVPYYRDDKCFDDGTGDNPVARPFPGEASNDIRVQDGYAALAGKPYAAVTCDEKQGAWASHGVHFFVTGDTDNAFIGKPINEIDGRQWQFAVPTAAPTNVGQPYANTVISPLKPLVTPQA